jgi:hypothetical protein
MPLLATLEPIGMIVTGATLLTAEMLASLEMTAAAFIQPGAVEEVLAAMPAVNDLTHLLLPCLEGAILEGAHVVAVDEVIEQCEDVAVHVNLDNLKAGFIAVAHGLGVFAFEVDVILEEVFEAVQDHGVLVAGLLFFVLLLFALVHAFVGAVGTSSADVV